MATVPIFEFPRLVAPAGRCRYVVPEELGLLRPGDGFLVPLGASGVATKVRFVGVDGTVGLYDGDGLVRLTRDPRGAVTRAEAIPLVGLDDAITDATRAAARDLLDEGRLHELLLSDLKALLERPHVRDGLMLCAGLAAHFQSMTADAFGAILTSTTPLATWMEGVLVSLADRNVSKRSKAKVRQVAQKAGAWRECVIPIPTDVATWVLFHPDDLAHRENDSSSWWTEDPEDDLAEGSLIGASTGSDGSFNVRFTKKPLTDRERAYLAGQAELRLDVRHGRLFAGSPDHLPSEDSHLYENDLLDPDGWLDLEVGLYRARISAIAWDQEPGALTADGSAARGALSAYVVELEPVEDLDDVPSPESLPELPPAR